MIQPETFIVGSNNQHNCKVWALFEEGAAYINVVSVMQSDVMTNNLRLGSEGFHLLE